MSMSCRAVIRSAAGLSDFTMLVPTRFPKQQLLADGSVFLIRLLQLWLVHSNPAARPQRLTLRITHSQEKKREREGKETMREIEKRRQKKKTMKCRRQ